MGFPFSARSCAANTPGSLLWRAGADARSASDRRGQRAAATQRESIRHLSVTNIAIIDSAAERIYALRCEHVKG